MMESKFIWQHPYEPAEKYKKRVAYFSMEFALDQSLKIFSGGLGFLAGSHMRSAYELKQNMIGVGLLWRYGYYDQVRDDKGYMSVQFRKRFYTFLQDTGIVVPIYIKGFQVHVKAMYLAPEVFGTVPMYFLTTDITENDHLSATITNTLYDQNANTRVAQSIVLGVGGAKVVEALGGADIYHLNEAHALPLAFHLYRQFDNDIEKVKKHVIFTTHTPEAAGNSVRNVNFLEEMGFFNGTSVEEVKEIAGVKNNNFSYTPAALRIAQKSNAVSQLHCEVANRMWKDVEGKCEIIGITNAQNFNYWADRKLWDALNHENDEALQQRKLEMKKALFEEVADQTGKLFDPNVLTIVWARRFAAYKRADLIMRDIAHFSQLIGRSEKPIQIIWAGKPYPGDNLAISTFNHIRNFTYTRTNVAVLTGYELRLSALLKKGADLWLNTPRRPQEASGTSGMTAAMNGAINFSTWDGWIPEFGKHGENAFVIPAADLSKPPTVQDDQDYNELIRILESEIMPLYYDQPDAWLRIVKQSMRDVVPQFDSGRMADEYYERLYNS